MSALIEKPIKEIDQARVNIITKLDLAFKAQNFGGVHVSRVNFGETGLSLTLRSDKHLTKPEKDHIGNIAASALTIGELSRVYRGTLGPSREFVQNFYTTHISHSHALAIQPSIPHQSKLPHR